MFPAVFRASQLPDQQLKTLYCSAIDETPKRLLPFLSTFSSLATANTLCPIPFRSDISYFPLLTTGLSCIAYKCITLSGNLRVAENFFDCLLVFIVSGIYNKISVFTLICHPVGRNPGWSDPNMRPELTSFPALFCNKLRL